MFERIISNNMFGYFTANNLISPNQSDFKPGDYCINQLFEVPGVFLDITTAFEKLWLDSLIFK